VASRAHLTRAEAEKAQSALIQGMIDILPAGRPLALPVFGVFKLSNVILRDTDQKGVFCF